VGSALQNISENNGRFRCQFAASGSGRAFYSDAMNAKPIPSWPLAVPGRASRTRCAPAHRALRTARSLVGRSLAALALLAALLVIATPTLAEPSGLAADLEQQVRTLALDGAQTGSAAVSRIEVVVGHLDPRLRLAPCQQVEPYLPNGARLWGKTRIGLRCIEGARPWNVYLPITVKVWGRALVATAGAAAGSVLGPADLVEADVDLAEEFTAAVADPSEAVGRALTQSLKPGQSLRQAHLKPRQWFAAGEIVKVVAVGAGFSLEAEGQALTNGIEGQTARVRTENGRVLTGQPVSERRIELAL
jgi:flagella basal body P-ring formation protein FlgA